MFIFALCGVKQKSQYNSSATKEWQAGWLPGEKGSYWFYGTTTGISVQENDPGIECSSDADPGKIGNKKHSSRF